MSGDETGQIIELLNTILKRLDTYDGRFDAVDKRFDAQDKRFDAQDRRFDAVDQRFDAQDRRFDALDKRLDRIDARLDRFDSMRVELLAQSERVLNEMSQLRDDMTVVMARVDRVDATAQSVVVEVRAQHRQWQRMNARLTAVEEKTGIA